MVFGSLPQIVVGLRYLFLKNADKISTQLYLENPSLFFNVIIFVEKSKHNALKLLAKHRVENV